MSKGTRREREACDLFEQAGYETYRPATVQYGENDIFGQFDLIAMAPPRETWWVQVKANGARGIEAWAERVCEYFDFRAGQPAYLVPYDREGWRLIAVGESGRYDVLDERALDVSMGEGLVAFLRGEDE